MGTGGDYTRVAGPLHLRMLLCMFAVSVYREKTQVGPAGESLLIPAGQVKMLGCDGERLTGPVAVPSVGGAGLY